MKALLALQQPSGCWEGEMVWCTVILSQTVIVRHVVGSPFDASDRTEALRYFESTRTADGVWGLHPEASGSVFVTSLAYIAHRLLGVEADAEVLVQARQWLQRQPGGVATIPSWGKFWLAILGLYHWRGVNPIPPEAFLLPRWLPFHPRRWYCHTRAIYLAMAYLYGQRYRVDLGSLREELKRELFGDSAINFTRHRHDISPTDLFVRPPWIVRRTYDLLALYERFAVQPLRRRALTKCLNEIVYEQQASHFEGLSPVNGLLSILALFSADHAEWPASLAGIEAWRWHDATGLRYVGARSQTWDSCFALQALLGQANPNADAVANGYQFLNGAQIVDELLEGARHDRSTVRGGWCFTEGRQCWPVSDCTAEALEVVLAIHRIGLTLTERISDERLMWAVEFILSRQNPDGGFSSYEVRRGHRWLQRLNPSEMFARCMVEESYVECTGSCVSALCHFREVYPDTMRNEINHAVEQGVRYIRQSQKSNGAWPAAWGIHHTYSAFFAVRGLRAAGVNVNDPCLAGAAKWITNHQRPDGAWGEHFQSALTGESVPHPEGQPTMTAWAVLTLVEILGPDSHPVRRGVEWLTRNQVSEGVWPDGAVNGVFFGTSMLHYQLYPQYFPAWAVAKLNTVWKNPATEAGRLA